MVELIISYFVMSVVFGLFVNTFVPISVSDRQQKVAAVVLGLLWPLTLIGFAFYFVVGNISDHRTYRNYMNSNVDLMNDNKK